MIHYQYSALDFKILSNERVSMIIDKIKWISYFFTIKNCFLFTSIFLFWCVFSDAIIIIHKITELWKYFEKKKLNIFIFHLKFDEWYILIDRNHHNPKFSFQLKVMLKLLRCRKAHTFQTIIISIPNVDNTYLRPVA